MIPLAVTSPADAAEPTPTSFKERFDVPQTPRVQEMLASLTYYVPQSELTTASLPRRQTIVAGGAAIVGIASTYNPTDPKDLDAGLQETASGEKYDTNDWTAAIRTDLRAQFGGVRFGKNYQPTFALVQSSDKQVIVRINDVGPLKRGRIIDLNERTMRYFDPTMQIGLIDKVTVTPLAGQDWPWARWTRTAGECRQPLRSITALGPDLFRDLDDHAQLGPLLVLGQRIAFLGGGNPHCGDRQS